MNWHEKKITRDNDQNHSQHGGNGGNKTAGAAGHVDGGDGHGHEHGHTLSEKATSALALDMETFYTCRKWEPIHEWVSDRQVDYFKRKDLVQGGGNIQVLD